MPVRIVSVVAVPRTGSSHVTSLMANIDGVKMRLEIFHPQGALTLDDSDIAALAECAGQSFSGPNDPALVAWQKKSCRRALEALAPTRGALTFKLFPGHLPPAAITSDLVPWDAIGFISVRRILADSFISRTKAQQIGKHSRVDTTGVMVALDAAEFVDFVRRIRRWYALVEDAVERAGRPLRRLRYEDVIKATPEQAVEMLASELETLGVDGPLHITGAQALFSRQDRTERREDRVTNWDEFLRGVCELAPAIDPLGYI